jgi:Acetoacetate decarboxylase (ADC)
VRRREVMSSLARDEAPPPPYQTKCDGFGVLAAFDEAVVRSLLPPGIEPVDDMSGGINLYTAEQGYGLAPYSAFYFYVHVKGLDSSDGTKARWMLQGVYGPEARVPAALHRYYGLPVRAGESRLETKEASTVGIGTLAGREVVRIVVTPKPTTSKSAAGAINFPGQLETTHEIVVLQMPYIAEICDAEPVSIDITAPAGDPLNKVKPVKMLGAFAFKNFTFAFPRPASAREVKAQVSRTQ